MRSHRAEMHGLLIQLGKVPSVQGLLHGQIDAMFVTLILSRLPFHIAQAQNGYNIWMNSCRLSE